MNKSQILIQAETKPTQAFITSQKPSILPTILSKSPELNVINLTYE